MSENKNEKQQEIGTQKEQDEQIRETGQLTLDQNKRKHRIELPVSYTHLTLPTKSKV